VCLLAADSTVLLPVVPRSTAFRGAQGAADFRAREFQDGDLVLVWPGTYNTATWGLDTVRLEDSGARDSGARPQGHGSTGGVGQRGRRGHAARGPPGGTAG
jgi:hypothetical protein